MAYDFQNLSFDDFEQLTLDLLQKSLGIRLESFRTGRDGGVDLRFAPTQDETLIVQCKRYKPGAFAQLLSNVKREEKPKLDRLQPKRYILSTSCALSPDNKAALLEALFPYCQSTAEILGADELNALLREFEDVERRHFKLWLGSTHVLLQVLNAGIFNYSVHEVERLRAEISKYVIHDGFNRALKILDEAHHCIIVGIPGVGKTTAARLLLSHHLRKGYEVVSVTGDVEEAWRVIGGHQPDTKTIIYYDDFLGQMTFEQKMAKNEDRRLLDLIEHCRSSKHIRFILTTRDYILDQAFAAYEPLGRAEQKLKRSSVRLDDYDELVRARLFANHLQFSEIGIDVFKLLVDSRKYEEIINHRNFLPRFIEQICEQWVSSPSEPEEFLKRAISALNNPIEIWKRPFSQLSIEAKLLVYTLVSFGKVCESGKLESAWKGVCKNFSFKTDKYYVDVVRETEGSFTHTQAYESIVQSDGIGLIVGFINPSAREFVHFDLLNKQDVLEAVFSGAVSFSQLVFWVDQTQLISRSMVVERVAVFSGLIKTRAHELWANSEPELTYWHGGQKIRWVSRPRKVTLLNKIFDALKILKREDLVAEFVDQEFGKDVARFSATIQAFDLTWLPEVVEVIFRLLSDSNKIVGDWYENLNMPGWLYWADDMQSLRYVWEAIARVSAIVGLEPHQFTQVRGELIDKASDVGRWALDFDAAEEITDEADELERLMEDADITVELGNLLDQLYGAAEKTRRKEEDPSDVEISISAEYKDKPRAVSLVEDVFMGLFQQASEVESALKN